MLCFAFTTNAQKPAPKKCDCPFTIGHDHASGACTGIANVNFTYGNLGEKIFTICNKCQKFNQIYWDSIKKAENLITKVQIKAERKKSHDDWVKAGRPLYTEGMQNHIVFQSGIWYPHRSDTSQTRNTKLPGNELDSIYGGHATASLMPIIISFSTTYEALLLRQKLIFSWFPIYNGKSFLSSTTEVGFVFPSPWDVHFYVSMFCNYGIDEKAMKDKKLAMDFGKAFGLIIEGNEDLSGWFDVGFSDASPRTIGCVKCGDDNSKILKINMGLGIKF